MFSYLIEKRIILMCCIFTCLTTFAFTYTQNCLASSDRIQAVEDTNFNIEKKKTGFFNRILNTVFRKKTSKKISKKTDLSKLYKNLRSIENRIARKSRQKYRRKLSYKNRHPLTVTLKQQKRTLDRLANQRNIIAKQISSLENEQLIAKVNNKETSIDSALTTKVAKNRVQKLPSFRLTNTPEKAVLEKTNKRIKLTKKTPVIDKTEKEIVRTTFKQRKASKLVKESAESAEQWKTGGKGTGIRANSIDLGGNTNISDEMEKQIRKMVIDGTTDEIKVPMKNGDSIGVIKALVKKNIKRQNLTLLEKETINAFIAILGNIGNEEEVKFLSGIKLINDELDDDYYYTHNIYSTIWKLKKKIGQDRIETIDDFYDAIDYISYIYDYYKTNTNKNMHLYYIEIDFLSEIIEALSNSSYTQESVPVLAKLMEFKNKDFVIFVNKIIDKVSNKKLKI